MPRVVLQPCSGPASRQHYRDTIEKAVNIESVSAYLTSGQREALLAAHPDGEARIWGAKPGERQQHVTKWKNIVAGDHVFFAADGGIFADAVVVQTLRAPDLAKHLWGSSPTANGSDQTWELMFTLTEPRDVLLPYAEMNAVIGRKPNSVVQEFNIVPEDKGDALLALIGEANGASAQAAAPVATEVPLEANNVERYIQQHAAEPTEQPEAVKREAKLVAAYEAWLHDQGRTLVRHRIALPDGTALYTDAFEPATRELIEAKASAKRTYVRMGLGQLLDYGRFIEHNQRALLLPEQPAPDLLQLLHEEGVAVVWREDQTFIRADLSTSSRPA